MATDTATAPPETLPPGFTGFDEDAAGPPKSLPANFAGFDQPLTKTEANRQIEQITAPSSRLPQITGVQALNRALSPQLQIGAPPPFRGVPGAQPRAIPATQPAQNVLAQQGLAPTATQQGLAPAPPPKPEPFELGETQTRPFAPGEQQDLQTIGWKRVGNMYFPEQYHGQFEQEARQQQLEQENPVGTVTGMGEDIAASEWNKMKAGYQEASAAPGLLAEGDVVHGVPRAAFGGFKMSDPLLAAAYATNPISTVGGLIAGTALSEAGGAAARAVNASPETEQWAQLTGAMAGGFFGGYKASAMEMQSRLLSARTGDYVARGITPELAAEYAKTDVNNFWASGNGDVIGMPGLKMPPLVNWGRSTVGGVLGGLRAVVPFTGGAAEERAGIQRPGPMGEAGYVPPGPPTLPETEGTTPPPPGLLRGIVNTLYPRFSGSAEDLATEAFRPRNSKSNWRAEVGMALPDIARAAQSMGIDPQADNVTLPQMRQFAETALPQVWAEYQNRFLDPNAKESISVQPVADAIRATISQRMREQNPGLVRQIERIASTYEASPAEEDGSAQPRNLTVPELQARVSELNNQTRAVEARYLTDKKAAKADPTQAYKFAERDTLRSLLDQAMDASGPEGAQLRRRYGALNSVLDVISRRQLVADRGSKVPLTKSIAMLGAVAQIAHGAVTLNPHWAFSGAATLATMLAAEKYIQHITDPNYLSTLAMRRTTPTPAWQPAPSQGELPFPNFFGIGQTPPPQRTGPFEMPPSPLRPQEQLPAGPEQMQLPGGPEQRQLPAQGTEPRVVPRTGPFNMPPSVLGPQAPALGPARLPERQISPTPSFEAPTAPSASAEQEALQRATAQGRGPFAQEGEEPLAARPLGARGGAQATLGRLRDMNSTLDEGGPDRAATIHLDDNAHEALLDMGLGGAGRWKGINLQVDHAQRIANEMRNRANAAEQAQEPDIAKNFRTLADNIDRVATLNYDPNAGHAGVPLIHDLGSLAHEAGTHGGQRAFAGGEGQIRNFTDAANVMSHPAAVKATPVLTASGYPNQPAVLAAEMEAHILDGNFGDLGLTREEAIDFMKHSRRVLAEHHGPDAMLDPPRLAQQYLQSIDRFIGGAGGETGATATAEAAQPTGTAGGFGENVRVGETPRGAGGGGNRAAGAAGPEEVGPSEPLAARSLKEQKAYDQQAEAKRISARKPTSDDAPENPLTSDLRIDTDAIRKAGLVDKVARVVGQYPGVQGVIRDLGLGQDSESVLTAFQRHLMDNYLFLHDNYPAEFRDQAVKWYDGANDIETRQWPKLYGTTDMQNGGGMAAISPKLDWNKNIGIQQRLIDAMKQQDNLRFTSKMQTRAKEWMQEDPTSAPLVKQLMGRKLGDLESPLLKALWIHIYQEAEGNSNYDMYAPDGTKVGIARRNNGKGPEAQLGWTMDGNVAKAVSIFEDPSRENIDAKLGDAHKIRSFYNNKIAPNSPAGDTVSDTHHVAAGLMRPLGMSAEEVGHNFGGPPTSVIHGIKGTYALYADANRAAAAQRDLRSRQMQSVVWDNGRALFPAKYKTDANNAIISGIWRDYDSGKITNADDARQQIVDAAGGWKPPDWATYGRGEAGSRSYPGRNVSAGTAAKSRNVPAPAVSGAEAGAKGSVGGRGSNAPAAVSAVTGGIPQTGRSAAPRTGRGGATVASPIPPQLKRVIRK